MSAPDLAAVLAEHRTAHNPASGGATCSCGWTGAFTRCPTDTSHHLADVVLDHLAAVASDAAVVEVVAAGIKAGPNGAWTNLPGPVSIAPSHATAALAAFVGHLRGDGEAGR